MNTRRLLLVGLLVFSMAFASLPATLHFAGGQAAARQGAVAKSSTAVINQPADGATVSGTTVIEVYASATYYMRAWLYIDGVQEDYWTTKGTRSWNWDTTQEEDGQHEIKLVVKEYWWIFLISSAQDIVTVTVDNGGGAPDTTPPTVTITSPEDGATLTTSDVTVTWTGSDDESGIDYYETRIDAGDWIYKGTSTSHTFTGLADGDHTVDVRAWDKAGNSNTDTVTFTVDTSGGGGGEPVTYTFTGSISQGEDSPRHQFDVPPDTDSVEVVLEMPAGTDFDLSLWDDQGRRTGGWTSTEKYTSTEIPNSQYSGYSADPETIDVVPPATSGTWEVGCYSYRGSGTYTITVTVTPESGGGGGGDGVVTKWAVIVGISDYEVISDLSYCDEDATDWYNHLSGTMNFDNIWVYGDTHSANYPKYDGLATEYNVKQALQNMVSQADADDIIAFISSGHGSGDGYGSSFLCMWDCNSGESGEDGKLYDTELAAILDDAVADRIFVFLDHCYSGGFGDDLMGMPNSAHVYLTTTCTENGYGYDDPTHQNGAWTYYFLEYSWINHYGGDPNVSMEDVFSYAHANYPYGGGDEPQEFDGDTANPFYLS